MADELVCKRGLLLLRCTLQFWQQWGWSQRPYGPYPQHCSPPSHRCHNQHSAAMFLRPVELLLCCLLKAHKWEGGQYFSLAVCPTPRV